MTKSESAMQLEFVVLPGRFALSLLPPGTLPPELVGSAFAAVIRSAEGISLVCPEDAVPPGAQSRGGFRCLQIAGSFGLDAVGVAAAATAPLADAGVSVFVYATWETDYILLQQSDLERAVAALTSAGHVVPI